MNNTTSLIFITREDTSILNAQNPTQGRQQSNFFAFIPQYSAIYVTKRTCSCPPSRYCPYKQAKSPANL